jgi:hypothetical protein
MILAKQLLSSVAEDSDPAKNGKVDFLDHVMLWIAFSENHTAFLLLRLLI